MDSAQCHCFTHTRTGRMQTLDTSAPYVSQMPEGQNPVAWTQAYTSMEQSSNPYVMNVIKADHTRGRVMEPQVPQPQAGNLLPPNPASVITATYNPTYNRCLPKILSDLDCEMKIKQVLKCIENILLDGSELDPQQSYKLPDRSSSPQLVPKKKIRVKEDEDMPMLSNTANSAKPGAKSPVRIAVKVEPSSETEKAQRVNAYQEQAVHQVPSASPRAQAYDFAATRVQQVAPNTGFPKSQTQQRPFSFEPYTYSNPNPASAAHYMHQSFLQHPQVSHQQHQSLLLQQQQHMHAVQQHLQAQQQLLSTVNSVGAMHPLLHSASQQQYTLPQANPHIPNSQPHPQVHDGHPPASSQPQVQDGSSFTPVQMDEFPFPVFSSTILEEVNQFKPVAREETKKQGEADEPVFFFGGSPTNAALWNVAQLQADATQQAMQQQSGEGSLQDQIRQASGLGSSALLQQSLPLLFQMPQLSGLEEDDKWILSLLNIDGPHENVPTAPGF